MLSSPLYKASPVPVQEALLSGRAWLRRQLRERGRFNGFLDEALRVSTAEAVPRTAASRR